MSTLIKIAAVVLLALAFHLMLGWAWSPVAGLAAGFWIGRRGWIAGMAAVGLSWLLLVTYSFAAAPRATAAMADVFGGILGNLPGAAIVGMTLLIGALLGALGGLAGSSLARLTGRGAAPVVSPVAGRNDRSITNPSIREISGWPTPPIR